MNYGGSEFTSIRLITSEREYQYYDLGYKEDHDAAHTNRELLQAASCYMLAAVAKEVLREGETLPSRYHPPDNWPWDADQWNPKFDNPIKMLTIAAALIAAEIDRRENLRTSQIPHR